MLTLKSCPFFSTAKNLLSISIKSNLNQRDEIIYGLHVYTMRYYDFNPTPPKMNKITTILILMESM